MSENDLQNSCERGQQELMETQYLQAARTLAMAEQTAWMRYDLDTLARLYMPLQEARRQIRQRCGEGTVSMHLLAKDSLNPVQAGTISHGQLLVAGWGTIQPAMQIRQRAIEDNLYVETFLAAVYPVTDSNPLVLIAPTDNCKLPDVQTRSGAELHSLLPFGCLLLDSNELPPDAAIGNTDTFAGVMDLWERLHKPFLQTALDETDPIRRMQAYRTTLQVDPACELAHQFLAEIARDLVRQR